MSRLVDGVRETGDGVANAKTTAVVFYNVTRKVTAPT